MECFLLHSAVYQQEKNGKRSFITHNSSYKGYAVIFFL